MTPFHRLRPFTQAAPCLLIALGMVSSAWADKIFLKSGQMIEGTVLENLSTATEIVVETKTGTIKEKKKILKADVDRIEKPKPDDLEVVNLRPLLPTPPMLPVTEYTRRVDLVTKFLSTYPDSAHKAEVEKIAATLNEEKAKVEAGGIQFDLGVWLNGDEARAHKDNIEAQKKFLTLQARAAQGNHVAALREFEDIEANWYGTYAYPKAIEAAVAVVRTYGNSLVTRMNEQIAIKTQEETRFAALTPAQQAEIKAAKADETARYDAFLAKEKATKTKFLSINPSDPKTYESAISVLTKENTRLSAIDVTPIREQADLYYKAETLLGEKKVAEAKAAILAAGKVKTGRTSSKTGYLTNLNLRVKETETLVKQEGEIQARLEADKLAKAKAEADAAKAEARAQAGATGGTSALDALNQLNQTAKKAAPAEPEKPAATAKKTTKTSSKAKTTEESADEEDPTAKKKPSSTLASSGGGIEFSPMMLVYILAPIMLGVTGFLYMKEKKKQG